MAIIPIRDGAAGRDEGNIENPAVAAVFEAWRAAEIDFLVLRNHHQLSDGSGNDIDILVERRAASRAEKLLVDVLYRHGFAWTNRAEFGPVSLFFVCRKTGAQVHWDLFTALTWRGVKVLPAQEVLKAKLAMGPYWVPEPAHAAVLNLLTRLLFHGYVKDAYKPEVQQVFTRESGRVSEVLCSVFGADLACAVQPLAAANNWTEVERMAPALRRRLISRFVTKSTMEAAVTAVAEPARLLKRFASPPGLFIVLMGPDGSGKSAVARGLADALAGLFPPEASRYFHWKPAIFPRRRRSLGPVTDPHRYPPRGRVASHVYFAAHWLEFLLGSQAVVRAALFRNGLVVIDRYFLDFLADRRRYRINVSSRLVRSGYRLQLQPHLVFVLDAPASVLQSRKQEVPPEESERQRMEYRSLAQSLPNAHVLDASQPLSDVVAAASRIILEFLELRQVEVARFR